MHALLMSVSKADKEVVLDDFNARVGTDHAALEGELGPRGLGYCKVNDVLLRQNCADNSLLLTNAFFGLPRGKKATRMYPRSRHWYLLGHAFV
ncbi:unnamed protein product [Schistocephalus solidus]|uniref:Endo/exonuclease/phosphatase domain-containing protein n=1 Tax=Schistocephalus solidus TaxID=70667 RepID=A0A183TB39_SCHSO|nr:unnamed protein product [Schistocephalus solidus]